MKTLYSFCAHLILNLVICANAWAAGSAYDLTTPDKTIQSFFAAIKAKDTKGVETMLSPRIKGFIESRKFSLEEYINIWAKDPPVEIGKAADTSPPDHPGVVAKAQIVYQKDGKNVTYPARVVKIDDRWLWDEK